MGWDTANSRIFKMAAKFEMADKTENCFGPSWFSLTNVRKQVLFSFSYITTLLGGRVGLGYVENKANSVQFQL